MTAATRGGKGLILRATKEHGRYSYVISRIEAAPSCFDWLFEAPAISMGPGKLATRLRMQAHYLGVISVPLPCETA